MQYMPPQRPRQCSMIRSHEHRAESKHCRTWT